LRWPSPYASAGLARFGVPCQIGWLVLSVSATLGVVGVVGVRPGISVVGTLARAYRRAVRDGQAVVGSHHVLRYGAIRVGELHGYPLPGSPRWRLRPAPVDPDPPAGRAQLFAAFDRQVELFTDGAVREAAFDGGPGAVTFSPLVRHAVYEAVHEASRRDGVPAGVGHLLAAVFAAAGSAAMAVAVHVPGPVHLDRQSPGYRAGDESPPWAPEALKVAGVLPSDSSRAGRLLLAAVTSRPFRRRGNRYRHPIPVLIEADARRQAVRLGRAHTGTIEVLLSMLELHEQLDRAGATLPQPVARYNCAGRILRDHGITYLAALTAAAELPAVPHVAEPLGSSGRPSRHSRPAFDAEADAALHTASAAGGPYGTTQQLASILHDSGGSATRLLTVLGVDPDAVRRQLRSSS
jgi:hypothetical protein